MAVRVTKSENILSTSVDVRKKKKKKRNYSFSNSKRLPIEKMTSINGVKIPAMPGSCYHAIMVSLAQHKDKFQNWAKIIQDTDYYMRMYGGQNSWDKFANKTNVKSYQQRIKDNTHTLTRTGKDCYGFRLHEQGMCIYYFKDGAMLVTGGKLVKTSDKKYDIEFPDGRRLQTRYRGTTMTYKEYVTFLSLKLIDNTGKVLNQDKIREMRMADSFGLEEENKMSEPHVCVVLGGGFDQYTADRLERIGLKIEFAEHNELIGTIPECHLNVLKSDKDVLEVEISGH